MCGVCMYICIGRQIIKIIIFRLRHSTFHYLLLLLRDDLEGENNFGRMTISAEKQLYIALYVLGTPDSYR